MFGYIRVNQPELKVKDLERYRAYYCGLCSVIGSRYGLFARTALNYDMTFLYLLHAGLYEDTEKDVVYHACVIPDATACCAQGIEFVLAGEHSWPEDYPEEATDIIVTGRLETYEEDGYMFLHLVDATVEVAAES